MKFLTTLTRALFFSGCLLAQNVDSITIRKIYDEALGNGHAYKNLEYLCKKIGPRLSGSQNAQKAVDWTKKVMEDYGFDKVYLQEVMVSHWERGARETAYIIEGSTKIPVRIAALGGSIASPAAGITAQVIEVKNFEELRATAQISKWRSLFDPYRVTDLLSGEGGADIGPLKTAVPGIVLIGLKPDPHRYFDIHHASSDVFENVNKRELELGAASMASLIYLIDKYGIQ